MSNSNKITKRYYELLKKEKQLENVGISARECIKLPEMKELSGYKIALENGKQYQNKKLYLDCIEKFLSKTIDGDEMTGTFMMLQDSNLYRKLTSITD